MKKTHNIDPGRDEGQQSEASTETGAELPGTYYYDDSTGYEIFTDDDNDEEGPPRPPDEIDQPS